MKFKFIGIFVLTVSISVLGSGYLYSYLVQSERHELMDLRIQTYAENLKQVDFDKKSPMQDLPSELSQNLKSAGLVWIWQKDSVLRTGGERALAKQVLSICREIGWSHHRTGQATIRCLKSAPAPQQPLILVATVMAVGTEPFFISKYFYLYFFSVSLLTALFAWIMAQKLFNPISKLRKSIYIFLEYIRSGDYQKRESTSMVHKSSNELNDLLSEFDLFLDKINETLLDLRTHSSSLIHEVNTPLSIILLQIADLQKKGDRVSTEDLRNIKIQTERLSRFMKDYHQFAETQIRSLHSDNIYSFDFIPMVQELITNLNFIHHDRIKFFLISETERILGSPQDLEHLLQNIMVNALRHSPKNSEIRVEVSDQKIKIIDNGPGLPREVLKNLGQPFNRGQKYHGTHGFQHGLGLSICLALAKKNHWRLRFENVQSGLRVCIELNTDEPFSIVDSDIGS